MANLRHGDLLIRKVEDPKNLINTGIVSELVLAEGETTGHKHLLTGEKIQTWKDVVGNIYVQVLDKPATLTHEEHKTLTLEIGEIYAIEHEKEYDYFTKEISKVTD